MSNKGITKNEKDLGVLSKHHSRRDLPSHTKLKYRQSGQNTSEDLKKKNYKRELEEKERSAYEERLEKNKSHRHSLNSSTLAITAEETQKSSQPSIKKIKSDHIPLDIDADDPVYLSDDQEDNTNDSLNRSDDSENEDSDEDETANLLAELNKLKKERAIEDAKREAENKAKEEKIRIENILHGNPLNSKSNEFKVKRRWNDDVVFKNCSRGDIDEKEKGFINDTLRSDFHRKFMEKYIK